MRYQLGAVRNLLYNLVRRDLTVRYKSTVLGFFWSFVKPLVLTAIFFLVFKILSVNPTGVPFHLFLLTGILAWTFFSGATTEAMFVILSNSNLIKKVRLPLGVFPLAAVCSHLIHFMLAFLVLIAMLIFSDLPPRPAFALVPLIMALQFLLTLAISMTLAALNVFYRDVASLWEVMITAWFYATPIVYPIYTATSKLDQTGWGWLKWVYLANPMTPIVLAYRRVLLYAALDQPLRGQPLRELPDTQLWISLGLCFVTTSALFWLSWKIFSHYSKSFADEL